MPHEVIIKKVCDDVRIFLVMPNLQGGHTVLEPSAKRIRGMTITSSRGFLAIRISGHNVSRELGAFRADSEAIKAIVSDCVS